MLFIFPTCVITPTNTSATSERRLDRNMLYADGESKLAQGLVNHQAISYTRS
jgi:hypothetical protein